jgi:hypothetical protein
MYCFTKTLNVDMKLQKKWEPSGSRFFNIYSELFQVVAWLQACHFFFGKAGSFFSCVSLGYIGSYQVCFVNG